MVAVSDYVSIHVPSLPDTKGMINRELISKMKDGVIILNYARPDLVVEDDIIEGIESGKIRKYMTDLADENMINRKGIVATPHLGASTREAEDNCASMAVDELMAYIRNGNVLHSVNLPDVELDEIPNTRRISIIYKSALDIMSIISKAVGEENIVKAGIGFSRDEYGYALVLVKDTADIEALSQIDSSGITRLRVL